MSWNEEFNPKLKRQFASKRLDLTAFQVYKNQGNYPALGLGRGIQIKTFSGGYFDCMVNFVFDSRLVDGVGSVLDEAESLVKANFNDVHITNVQIAYDEGFDATLSGGYPLVKTGRGTVAINFRTTGEKKPEPIAVAPARTPQPHDIEVEDFTGMVVAEDTDIEL
jgi:hypothetical protein